MFSTGTWSSKSGALPVKQTITNFNGFNVSHERSYQRQEAPGSMFSGPQEVECCFQLALTQFTPGYKDVILFL